MDERMMQYADIIEMRRSRLAKSWTSTFACRKKVLDDESAKVLT